MSFCQHDRLITLTLKQKNNGKFLSSTGCFFKSLRFGGNDDVSCVDLSRIRTSSVSHGSFMLLGKRGPGDGWMLHKSSVTKEKGLGFSWLLSGLAFRS